MGRAAAFYEQVFGVTLVLNEVGDMQMAWFPMAPGVSGAGGTLVQGDGYEPTLFGTLVYFEVGDVDDTLARVEGLGGRTLLPKTSIGEHGFIAHFEDSEGNRIALHSRS
jgi:predicted enzyme related to lactoylglutathione lyase